MKIIKEGANKKIFKNFKNICKIIRSFFFSFSLSSYRNRLFHFFPRNEQLLYMTASFSDENAISLKAVNGSYTVCRLSFKLGP